jgi:hypothetical protein
MQQRPTNTIRRSISSIAKRGIPRVPEIQIGILCAGFSRSGAGLIPAASRPCGSRRLAPGTWNLSKAWARWRSFRPPTYCTFTALLRKSLTINGGGGRNRAFSDFSRFCNILMFNDMLHRRFSAFKRIARLLAHCSATTRSLPEPTRLLKVSLKVRTTGASDWVSAF